MEIISPRLMAAGRLRVYFSHATDLRAADASGSSDPYFKITVGMWHFKTTEVVKETLNPRYDCEFVFGFGSLDLAIAERISLKALDFDMMSLDDSLGQGSIELGPHRQALRDSMRVNLTVPLVYKRFRADKGVPAGQAYLSIIWEPTHSPSKIVLPPPKAVAMKKLGGRIQVHVSHAASLLAADKSGLSDPYIKCTLMFHTGTGLSYVERSQTINQTLNPHFDWTCTFPFHFEQVDEAARYKLQFEAFDYDSDSLNDPLGYANVALYDHWRAMAEEVPIELILDLKDRTPTLPSLSTAPQRVNNGRLFVTVSWVADVPDEPEAEEEPLLAPEPEPEKPQPWLLISLVFGLPLFFVILAIGAEYNSFAVTASGFLPLICIAAYLLSPLAPAEDDPNEPPLPTLEMYLWGPLAHLIQYIIDTIAELKSAFFGTIFEVISPAIMPHVLLIAQTLQLSMGIMALVEMGVSFAKLHTIASGVITLIMTLVAVPESFGWAIKSGNPVGDVWTAAGNGFRDGQANFETAMAFSADHYVQLGLEKWEVIKDQAAEASASITAFASDSKGDSPIYNFIRPFIRLALVRIDEIGEVVRGAPLLLVVLVLDSCTALNDMPTVVPPLHIYAIEFYAFFFPPVGNPTQWASTAQGGFDGPTVGVTNGTCGTNGGLGSLARVTAAVAAACGAIGPVVAETCAASNAWALSSSGGPRLIFDDPMRGAYLDVHYQLSLPSGWRQVGNASWLEAFSPARFTLRVDLFGNESLPDGALTSVEVRRAYDVTVSLSLLDETERNISITPLSDDAPFMSEGKPRKFRPVTLADKAGVVVDKIFTLPVIKNFKPSPPPPAWLSDPSSATAACLQPLRLRILPFNNTHDHPITQSVAISLQETNGLGVSLDAIALEGRPATEEWEEGAWEEFEFEDEEEAAEVEHEQAGFPIEEVTAVLAAIATAAASSDFVRAQIKPEEYAKQRAREAAKKEALKSRNGAENEVKALIGTPLDRVDIAEAKRIIEEAEDGKVLPSLIDKAVVHVQDAIELQMMGGEDLF